MAVLHFSEAAPTFLENWSPVWTAAAPESVSVRLDPSEIRALGAMQSVWGEAFGRLDRTALERVRHKIEQLYGHLRGDTAIRLGSRSPKDADLAIAAGMCVSSPERAFALMIDGSERLAIDLRDALANSYASHLFLRRWIDAPSWGEIRVFICKRRIVGAFAPKGEIVPDHQIPNILRGIKEVGSVLARGGEPDSFVADLLFQVAGPPMLLDINPYHPLSGAGPFCWNPTTDRQGDFDGTFRFEGSAGGQSFFLDEHPLSET